MYLWCKGCNCVTARKSGLKWNILDMPKYVTNLPAKVKKCANECKMCTNPTLLKSHDFLQFIYIYVYIYIYTRVWGEMRKKLIKGLAKMTIQECGMKRLKYRVVMPKIQTFQRRKNRPKPSGRFSKITRCDAKIPTFFKSNGTRRVCQS